MGLIENRDPDGLIARGREIAREREIRFAEMLALSRGVSIKSLTHNPRTPRVLIQWRCESSSWCPIPLPHRRGSVGWGETAFQAVVNMLGRFPVLPPPPNWPK